MRAVKPVLAIVALMALMRAAPSSGGDLTLVVEDVRDTRGVIGVLVFSSPDGWPEHVSSAFTSMALPAQAPVTTLTIHDLPPGEYAVVVLHDENSNMKLDRNWLGMPKEQWGMSNNPHASLSAPSFESAEFSLSGNEQMRIRLRE
jgi:uncharacterized protein (DUF2141 family)